MAAKGRGWAWAGTALPLACALVIGRAINRVRARAVQGFMTAQWLAKRRLCGHAHNAAMLTHLALLRAVNVGGTGLLNMAELRALAEGLGFTHVRTHLASGNLLVDSPLPADAVRERLTEALAQHLGRAVSVVMRRAEDLARVLRKQPFTEAASNRVLVSFLPGPVPTDALATVHHQRDEQIALLASEVVVHYGAGMGASKLRVPAAETGTARNLNTVAALLCLMQS
jgi:uncharacterized protein (DUF1697 family)